MRREISRDTRETGIVESAVLVSENAPTRPAEGRLRFDKSRVVLSTVSIVAKTANYTLTNLDTAVWCTGTFTITLPAATTIGGKEYEITNVSTGIITLATADSATINTFTTVSVLPGEAMIVRTDGTNWWVT